jgi:hypothetical protein
MFCQGVTDTLSVGGHHRILAKDPIVRFGSLLLLSGEYTSSGEEALKLMLETHFPDSVDGDMCREQWSGASSQSGRSVEQGLGAGWLGSVS